LFPKFRVDEGEEIYDYDKKKIVVLTGIKASVVDVTFWNIFLMVKNLLQAIQDNIVSN